MNVFLMVVGIFLMTCGAIVIGSTVYTGIREAFEDGDDELGIALIFLIVIGILGIVIFCLAYHAEVTRTAYESLHTMYSEVTTG